MTPGAGVLVLGRGHMSFVLCDKTFMQFFFSVPRASNYFQRNPILSLVMKIDTETENNFHFICKGQNPLSRQN